MTPEELKNIAPKLSELKSMKTGFEVPLNYFESIEEKVFSKIDFKGDTSNDIPEGYFDTIENRVFDKLKSKETKVINLKSRFVKIIVPLVIAASILLFITLQIYTPKQEDVFASLKTSDIETWIANGDLELSTYEIAAIYEDANFENIELYNDYTEDELIDYLDNIDLESLLTN